MVLSKITISQVSNTTVQITHYELSIDSYVSFKFISSHGIAIHNRVPHRDYRRHMSVTKNRS